MSNNYSKERGLSVNSQIRCFNLLTGNKPDGSLWGLITHVEKDSNKKVLQKYSVWIMNDGDFISNFPLNKTVDVKIDSITSIRPENKSYMKDGKQIFERVINISAYLSIVNVMENNTYNPNYNYNQQSNQTPQYQQPQQPSSFDVGDNKFKNQPKQEPSEEVKEFLDDANDDDLFNDLPF